MATFKTLIDDILLRLGDDGTLFSRDEILRWLNEGYRRFTNQTRHAKTFTALDMPPRYTRAITFDWEANEFSGTGDGYGGTYRKWTFTHSNGQRECTFLWEVQQADDVTPTNSLRAVSQLWEISSQDAGEADAYYRFVLPRNESVIHGVWHDHERLEPVTTKILDTLEDSWWRVDGEPIVYNQTLGDFNTFDVYEIETVYQQAYSHRDAEQGSPRGFLGDRTYVVDSKIDSWGYAYAWNGEPAAPSEQLTGPGRRFTFGPEIDQANGGSFFYTHDWEGQVHRGESVTASNSIVETNPFRYDPSVDPPVETITAELEIGIFRKAISPDRQYWPSGQWQVFGIAKRWDSSEDNILVYHSVNSEDILNENDDIELIPKQIHKYLAYYALFILFNRQGEGYDPSLAQHYLIRANRGVVLLNKLSNTTRVNESYVRGSRGDRPRVRTQLPQLPSNFPRAPWLRR